MKSNNSALTPTLYRSLRGRGSVRAMVMAAGAGTRLRPLTDTLPKPMVPIGNRPVLEYTVENLRRHGIREMVFNLHSFPNVIQKHFGNGAAWGVHIEYSHEPRLRGTAGGVKKVESFLDGGTFLVMSGDGLTNIDLTALLKFHRERGSFATMALKPVETRFEYGVTLTSSSGRISRFVEKPLWSDVFSNHVNTGIYVFEAAALKLMPARTVYDFGHEFWPKLLRLKKPIYGYHTKAYWCDVGNLSEYRRAQRDFLEGKTGLRMPGKEIRRGVWAEENVRIDRGVRIEGPCLIGSGSHLKRGAMLGSHTLLGRNVTLGPRSAARNSILWDGVRLEPGVKLDNCVVTHGVIVRQTTPLFNGDIVDI